MWFWKRKKLVKTEKQIEAFNLSVWVDLINKMTENKKPFKFEEPLTIAKERLEQGARDFGYARGVKCYNEHKTKVQNQWINPMQSINTGFGTAQYAYYNYQNVNYYECYALAQDPLMNKIFDILAKTPFMQGGEVVSDFSDEDKEVLRKGLDRYQVRKNAEDAVRSSFVCGGCLLYMDFGLDNLEEPLNLKRQDMRQFKGFRHIDPINLVAVDVNTVNPSASDYMEPNIWYVVGLGNVHKSHFLKFEENIPEKIMRPLSMYFGMPLTLLIKQDVANSNLASQGLANLMNRFRTMYLSTDSSNFTGAGAQNFRQRLEVMSLVQDNFSIYPIKDTEQIQQFVTSLSGMNENVELFYQIISAKTDITMSILMGKGASGLSGTLEGERKNFYDRIRRIQENIKSNLIKMYGIVYGKMTDGKFYNFSDYVFEPLEQATETEKAENLRSYVEVARSLVELGGKAEDVMDWLKQYKDFQLENVNFDTDTADLQDYEENKTENGWITVKPHGDDSDDYRRLYVDDDETPADAMRRKGWDIKDEKDSKKESEKTEPKKEEQEKSPVQKILDKPAEEMTVEDYNKIRDQYYKNRDEFSEQVKKKYEWFTNEMKTNKEYLKLVEERKRLEDDPNSTSKELYEASDKVAKMQMNLQANNEFAKEMTRLSEENNSISSKIKEFQGVQEERKAKERVKIAKDNYLPQSMANAIRGEEMSFEQADSGNVNPNVALGSGYRTNCQSGVVVYEARRRGYDVEALPNTRGSVLEALSHNYKDAWIDPETGKAPKGIELTSNTVKAFKEQALKAIDEEGRYNLRLRWRDANYGHVTTIGKENGELFIYDPQINKKVKGADIDVYLQNAKMKGPQSRPEIIRVDKLAFNPQYFNKIMKKKGA